MESSIGYLTDRRLAGQRKESSGEAGEARNTMIRVRVYAVRIALRRDADMPALARLSVRPLPAGSPRRHDRPRCLCRSHSAADAAIFGIPASREKTH